MFVTACILLPWLNCSLIIPPELLQKDYLLVRFCCSSLRKASVIEYIFKEHFDAYIHFPSRILKEPSHLLHGAPGSRISTCSTRSKFNILYFRTSWYWNSLLSYLAPVQIDPTGMKHCFRKSMLEWKCNFSFIAVNCYFLWMTFILYSQWWLKNAEKALLRVDKA